MYKVSVIIPVYNVQNYIVRCAESLFNQTLDDMQFIFVDDASPDNSIVLLEQVMERFPRRKAHTCIVHHPQNLGLPTARATGLSYVEAPYVAHCDSDDYVEPTMYAKLYECAIRNDSDMVVCDYKTHYADGRTVDSFDRPNPKDSLIYNYLYGRLHCAVWCRLTRTDIYRRVRFPTENCLEDRVQTIQLLTYAKRISFLDESLYHYDQRHLSITTDKSLEIIERNVQQCIINHKLIHDFILQHYQVEEKDFLLDRLYIRNQFLPQIKRSNIRKRYLHTFPELNSILLFDFTIPLHHKLFYLLVLLRIYPIAKSVYDRIKNMIGNKKVCYLKTTTEY